MNKIQEFVSKDFGTIRMVVVDNEPWFVAKDVCDILGVQNVTQSMQQLENFERSMFNIGRQGEANIISESGFYTLVLRSRKPIAKPFRLWVTQEVLPQIRKTGGYIPINEEEPNELFLARAVQIANETIKHKDEIIDNQKKRIKSLEETEKDWKLLMDTKGTFSVNEIAHFIGIGEYNLFKYMRNIGLLFKNENNDNVPYENPTNRTKFIAVPAIAPDGTAHIQTRVKPDGISYITKLLRKYGYLEAA
ncbi:BRO family protein [Eubacterium sp.]|uniref:BRO family protein n=1 Tax=Eubacterium sp. TaxID=142586 RepID=UPI001D63DF67|nr:BRO family protein [Eubacterium sp.]MBS5619679.1 phage antirepressor KilAC domain-containing protein [Eubacterium sp.]